MPKPPALGTIIGCFRVLGILVWETHRYFVSVECTNCGAKYEREHRQLRPGSKVPIKNCAACKPIHVNKAHLTASEYAQATACPSYRIKGGPSVSNATSGAVALGPQPKTTNRMCDVCFGQSWCRPHGKACACGELYAPESVEPSNNYRRHSSLAV